MAREIFVHYLGVYKTGVAFSDDEARGMARDALRLAKIFQQEAEGDK